MGFQSMRVRVLLMLAGLPLLTGCNAAFFSDGNPGSHASDYNVAQIPPVYCYNTLGEADCYDEPRETEAYRLINYVGPAPANRGFVGR